LDCSVYRWFDIGGLRIEEDRSRFGRLQCCTFFRLTDRCRSSQQWPSAQQRASS